MKTLFNSALPALALLALGGCATTGAISSTENDDVYYSSKDRTTYAAPATGTSYQSSGYQPGGYGSASTQTQAPADENANPDYQGSTAQAGTSTDYYDDNYTSYNSVQPSGFGQPYTGPGVSTYNYTPSWSVAPSFYGSPFGYGTGLSIGYGYGGFGGYSPFGYGYPAYAGFYDPFYSPFYSPWGYGSGLSVGFGYGFGGFGGFGYPYYGGFGSPYRYGYGYPGYAYGGGYGYGGDYYGYGRGGARNYVYKQGIMNGSYSNGYDPGAVKVGRRQSRYVDAAGSSGVITPGGTSNAGQLSNRRAAGGASSGFDRAVAPGGSMPAANGMTAPNQPAAATMDRGRRFDQPTMNPNSPGAAGAYNQPRMADAASPGAAQPQRRGGFFREMFANPNPGQAQGQNNGYAQPQQRNFDQQRAFSQPQPQQRTFQQPQQRTFEQPRMEQRSFSPAPSFGGSGGGGGGFGGGGGGGGRRGR
jgi:hypothetical protein